MVRRNHAIERCCVELRFCATIGEMQSVGRRMRVRQRKVRVASASKSLAAQRGAVAATAALAHRTIYTAAFVGDAMVGHGGEEHDCLFVVLHHQPLQTAIARRNAFDASCCQTQRYCHAPQCGQQVHAGTSAGGDSSARRSRGRRCASASGMRLAASRWPQTRGDSAEVVDDVDLVRRMTALCTAPSSCAASMCAVPCGAPECAGAFIVRAPERAADILCVAVCAARAAMSSLCALICKSHRVSCAAKSPPQARRHLQRGASASLSSVCVDHLALVAVVVAARLAVVRTGPSLVAGVGAGARARQVASCRIADRVPGRRLRMHCRCLAQARRSARLGERRRASAPRASRPVHCRVARAAAMSSAATKRRRSYMPPPSPSSTDNASSDERPSASKSAARLYFSLIF